MEIIIFCKIILMMEITFDVSLIRVKDGNMEFHTENNGKIWVAAPDEVQLEYPKTKKTLFKTI